MSSKDLKLHQSAISLVDELTVGEVTVPVAGGRGRLFSTAGRESPIGEFTQTHLILHAPNRPFDENRIDLDIVINANELGILLDELGKPKTIGGAKFRGNSLFWLAMKDSNSGKHMVGYMDANTGRQVLLVEGENVTVEMAYKLRNRTHDGELSVFKNVTVRAENLLAKSLLKEIY